MARIADADLERLKREISLVRLIEGQGIKLVSQGKDLACRCPWHEGAGSEERALLGEFAGIDAGAQAPDQDEGARVHLHGAHDEVRMASGDGVAPGRRNHWAHCRVPPAQGVHVNDPSPHLEGPVGV